MAVPPFHQFMRPYLDLLHDGAEHHHPTTVLAIADLLELSDEDRHETVASGGTTRLNDRANWARTYLNKAGLIRACRRGVYIITDRGKAFIKSHAGHIFPKDLLQFDEFRQFQTPQPAGTDKTETPEELPSITEPARAPEEIIDTAYRELRRALVDDTLERVKSVSSTFFERLVVDLLLAMGYGGSRREAGEVVGRSGDGGIDGIIKQDPLGLDVVYIQAKRYTDITVGRPQIQQFVGSVAGHQASKGVFITTSRFTAEAREYVTRSLHQKIVLIDGEQLAELMIDHNIGVAPRTTYVLKRVDSDYFEEG